MGNKKRKRTKSSRKITRCEFPEKLFESLVNHELMNNLLSLGLKPNMWSPSQIQEASLGYDVLFQDPLSKIIAIQYKVPSYKYLRKHKNCFKFDLHKNKSNICKQHEILVNELKKGTISNVVYMAPRFMGIKELNEYVQNGSLLKHIAVIPPARLPSYIGSHHCVYGKKKPQFFSKEPIDGFEDSLYRLFFDDDDIFHNSIEERKSMFKDMIDKNSEEMMGVMFYSIDMLHI